MNPLLNEAEQLLRRAGIEPARVTAERLLSGRLNVRPVDMYLEPRRLDKQTEDGFRADVAARIAGVPLQYLLGRGDFYGREFLVGPGVFIPRPETEVLVEMALARLRAAGPGSRVIDVGTGSGAIGITLALEAPGARVSAVDLSEYAVRFAGRNAKALGAGVELALGDLCDGAAPGSADLIVSNPPYLDPEKRHEWRPELYWEPWIAFDGGENGGTGFIRRLVDESARVLRPGGALIIEIGEEQAGAVRSIAEQNRFRLVEIVRDLAGRDRVAVLEPGR